MQKSGEILGFQKLVVTTSLSEQRSEYVISVPTELNAPNGVSIMSDLESGEVLQN